MNQDRHQRLKVPVHRIEARTVAELFKYLPQLRRYFANADLRIQVRKSRINTGANTLDIIDDELEDTKYIDETNGNKIDRDDVNAGPVWSGNDMVRLMKYIVFMYDEGTDLTDEFPDDVRLRKEAAAKEAGFRRESDGQWPQMIMDVMDFRDLVAIDLIMSYLKVQRNTVWRELKIIEEELDAFYRQRAKMIALGDISSRNDLLDITKKRIDEKEDLLKKFYGAHHDLREATEKDLLPVSPENVFSVMDFPEEFTRITQTRDVPAEARPH